MSFAGQLEPAQEERKARGKSVPIGPNPEEKATHELTHKLQKLVQLLRASQSRGRSTSQTTTQKAIMADYCFMQDAPQCCFMQDPEHVGCCSWHDGGNQCGGKGASCIQWSAVVEHLQSLGTEEGDLPHRRRTSDPSTGCCEFNKTGAKRVSSSVDRGVPHHRCVWLRT